MTWILEHVGERIAKEETLDAGIAGEVLQSGDRRRSLAPGIVLEPDQRAVVGNVEREIRTDRSCDHLGVVERDPLGSVDRGLTMLRADDHQRPLRQAAVL